MNNVEWIDRQEYPFESQFLDLDMGRMQYVDQGGGQPVVMVHGNPTWSFLYRHLIKSLSPDPLYRYGSYWFWVVG
jgi:haloalkane dehalogenase